MVVSTGGSSAVAMPASIDARNLAVNSAVDASISQYLQSGERVSTLMGVGWKVGAALMVLVAIAWVVGVLPGAIKLF